MPLRQQLLTKGLSTCELPILTFLAPRVFEPWPNLMRSSRALGTAPTTAGPSHAIEVENLPPSRTTGGSMVSNIGSRWVIRPRNNELRDSWRVGFQTMSTSMVSAGICADEERFRKAYTDIWGLDRAKKRFQDEYNPQQGDFKDISSIERKGSTKPVARRVRGPFYYNSTSTVRRRAPAVPTKLVRLTTDRNWRSSSVPRLETFSSIWSYNYTQLYRKYDIQVGQFRLPPRIQNHGIVDSTRFQRALSNASVKEVRKAWEALTHTERETLWIYEMLGALGRKPAWALKFLIATRSSKPYPPSYAISDSLEYLVCHFLHNAKNADDKRVLALFHTVTGLLGNFDHYSLHLSQKTIFSLLSHINIDQAELLYKVLVRRTHPLNEDTLLQFAHKFGLNGRIQLAVDVLQHFHNNGGDFAQPKVESVCSIILRRKSRKNSNSLISDSDIFGLLLDLGLRPNVILYNILLQNAVESGDSETAWKIHDMMPGLGIETDAHTYSILLNDAKLRMDLPAMKRIVEIVESKGTINEHVITDLLHAIFLIYEQEMKTRQMHAPPPAPFKRMLLLYAEYFDLEPIRGLLTPGYRDFAVPSDRPKIYPPKATLVVMLVALLRGFTNPTSAPEWYHRFRTMVLSGNPDIVPLTQSTHIYDAVIMCLGRWPVTLGLCTKVIGDMFSSYSAAQAAQNRLYLPIRNGGMLQTTMGSHSDFASTRHLGVHRLPRVADSRTNRELDGLPEGKSATELAEDVDAISEYPIRSPRSTELLPTASEVAAEPFKKSAGQVVIHGHCKPSVHTWSILLKAFMDRRQPRAAETVLTMMRRRGITPNIVTWNSLAIGYARLQDITSSVDVIERFESEGWEMGDITIQGLQVIVDREALMGALRRKDLRRIKKEKVVQEALDRELASSKFGSLRDVVHKEQLVSYYENLDQRSSDQLRETETRYGYRRPMAGFKHENEVASLEKAYPTRNPEDQPSEALVSSTDP